MGRMLATGDGDIIAGWELPLPGSMFDGAGITYLIYARDRMRSVN